MSALSTVSRSLLISSALLLFLGTGCSPLQPREQTTLNEGFAFLRDRGNDFLDITRLNLSAGPGLHLNASATRYCQIGGGYWDGYRFGWCGRYHGLWQETAEDWNFFYSFQSNFSRTERWGYVQDEWALERTSKEPAPAWRNRNRPIAGINLEAHLGLIGLETGVEVDELLDFLLGFLGNDILGDDLMDPEQLEAIWQTDQRPYIAPRMIPRMLDLAVRRDLEVAAFLQLPPNVAPETSRALRRLALQKMQEYPGKRELFKTGDYLQYLVLEQDRAEIYPFDPTHLPFKVTRPIQEAYTRAWKRQREIRLAEMEASEQNEKYDPPPAFSENNFTLWLQEQRDHIAYIPGEKKFVLLPPLEKINDTAITRHLLKTIHEVLLKNEDGLPELLKYNDKALQPEMDWIRYWTGLIKEPDATLPSTEAGYVPGEDGLFINIFFQHSGAWKTSQRPEIFLLYPETKTELAGHLMVRDPEHEAAIRKILFKIAPRYYDELWKELVKQKLVSNE